MTAKKETKVVTRGSIKMVNAALDEVDVAGQEEKQIILRGVLDPESLDKLKVDQYQREILPQSTLNGLIGALRSGNVPDIELGMRGGDFLERDGAFYLRDDIYIIDGLQRVTAAKHLVRLINGGEQAPMPRIGASLFFNTTEAWERERFRVLNSLRAKLSPNILLRNRRADFPVVDALYSLTFDRSFVLQGRVSWNQHQTRNELISAQTLLRTTGFLHTHLMAGMRSNQHSEILPAMQKLMSSIGRNVFRDNIRTFFDVIDQAFGIRSITFRAGAAYMRYGFLSALSQVMSNHFDFWRDNRLFVSADMVRKIKLFSLTDPHIRDLCSSGGQAAKILYQMLVEHLNSGKKKHRLKARTAVDDVCPKLLEKAEEGEGPIKVIE